MQEEQAAAVIPYKIRIAEREIHELHMRLDHIRWPNAQTVTDWSQGVPLGEMMKLADYWRNQYNWRRCEARLNSLPQFTTELDGLDIYFLHIRSSNEHALPIILTHGWPGSVLEFLKVIEPLSQPQNFGGDTRDAFHLVIPALPGYGFSGKPTRTGWGLNKIASNWNALMVRLGYTEYVAQGGDWGSAVTHTLAKQKPPGLKAIHTNLPVVMPPPPYESLNADETEMLQAMGNYQRWEAGYSLQQMTRPQTLGYGLADSPIGQAAWIFEKFMSWTDCHGNPLNIFSYDELLDNIMMYWLNNCAASSAQLYWESFEGAFVTDSLVPVPSGYSIFPKEIYKAPRSWAERCTPHLIHWNELERGGHFAAFEQPGLFVEEIRNCFRCLR